MPEKQLLNKLCNECGLNLGACEDWVKACKPCYYKAKGYKLCTLCKKNNYNATKWSNCYACYQKEDKFKIKFRTDC